MMKLIIAIVQDKDAGKLSETLNKNGVRATKLASTGGFLRAGSTTFLVGIEEDKVEDVLNHIKNSCQERTEMMRTSGGIDPMHPGATPVTVGGATVFVVPIEQQLRF
jgi:uncharacterized protein YaaQ